MPKKHCIVWMRDGGHRQRTGRSGGKTRPEKRAQGEGAGRRRHCCCWMLMTGTDGSGDTSGVKWNASAAATSAGGSEIMRSTAPTPAPSPAAPPASLAPPQPTCPHKCQPAAAGTDAHRPPTALRRPHPSQPAAARATVTRHPPRLLPVAQLAHVGVTEQAAAAAHTAANDPLQQLPPLEELGPRQCGPLWWRSAAASGRAKLK